MKTILIVCLMLLPATKAYCDFCWGADRQAVRDETGICETSQQSYDRQADERMNELRNSNVGPNFDDDDNNSTNNSTPTHVDLPRAAKRTPGIYSAYVDCYASLEGDARTINSKAQYYDGIWSKYSGDVYMSLATNYENASSKMLDESPLLILTDTSLRTSDPARHKNVSILKPRQVLQKESDSLNLDINYDKGELIENPADFGWPDSPKIPVDKVNLKCSLVSMPDGESNTY